ncbi:MAG: SDR family oxidoreductase [Haliea sp.]|nr:MAG: SDR family oxidoreductase [Haliea sp.]
MAKPSAKDQKRPPASASADAAAQKQRELQLEQDGKDAAKAPKAHAGQDRQAKKGRGAGRPARAAGDATAGPAPGQARSGIDKLKGMVALITGGDSGIGRAVAVLFAREGADVAIVYLSSHEDAQETKAHVEKEGRECLLIAGDVKDPKFCRQAVDRTVKQFDRLDILVNNAAFQLHAESIEDISDERLDETLRTNVFGYFYMARAAVAHLKRGGSIINTGSVTGLRGSGQLLDYSATKGAIHAFTMALASNLMDKGIRVNAIAPGPVWTPLNPADQTAEKIVDFGKDTDMKRPAQPEELSPAYVFLASPACSSYITGIVLPVTGSVGS